MLFKTFNFVPSASAISETDIKSQTGLLSIFTSEWVLRMPFTGQNHFFNAKTGFSIINRKTMQK